MRATFQDAGPLLPAFFAILGMIVLTSFISPATYHVGAFKLDLSLSLFDLGLTEIGLPPIGEVAAHTHLTPLKLRIDVKSVDLDLLQEMAAGDTEEILSDLRTRLVRVLRLFVVRTLALAALGGALGWMVVRPSPQAMVRGALVGLIAMGLLLGASYISYDISAFENPEYRGALEAAPWMIGLLRNSIVKLEELGEKMRLIATNLSTLFSRIEELEALDTLRPGKRVLLVADIHNNPAAVDLVSEVVRTFSVDFVVDAGDLTDFGTPLEAKLVEGIGDLGIPYLFAAGNHDAPGIIATLREFDNVIILDGKPVEVEGVRVMGFPDPSASSTSPAIPSAQDMERAAQAIDAALTHNPRPDLLVIHNPHLGLRFAKRTGVLVNGHTHAALIQFRGTVPVINPGTTGGAGIRGLSAREEIPFSLVLLHLVPGEAGARPGEWIPQTADLIEVYNLRVSFTLERIALTGEDVDLRKVTP